MLTNFLSETTDAMEKVSSAIGTLRETSNLYIERYEEYIMLKERDASLLKKKLLQAVNEVFSSSDDKTIEEV